jgi:hypothetical protein
MKDVTLDDLISGRVARLNTRQYAKLKNCQPCTEERKRSKGLGIPFTKDPITGAVYYMAEDVLAELQAPKHRSTAEYDTAPQIDRLARARQAIRPDGDRCPEASISDV